MVTNKRFSSNLWSHAWYGRHIIASNNKHLTEVLQMKSRQPHPQHFFILHKAITISPVQAFTQHVPWEATSARHMPLASICSMFRMGQHGS